MAAETNTDDFYARLVELAEQAQPVEGARMILNLDDVKAQLAMLQRLARHIEHDLVFAENLDFGNDFFLKLMYARDNAAALAGHFTRHIDSATAGFLARALARANRLGLILADPSRHSDTDHSPAAHKSRLAHDRLIQLNQMIAGVLNDLTAEDDTYLPATTEAEVVSAAPVMLILRGVDTLTPQNLSAHVTPYIQAIGELHTAIDRVTDEEGRDIKILSLAAGSSGVEVTFEGYSSIIEALGILRGTVFRQYRREYLLKKEALVSGASAGGAAEEIQGLLAETAERIVKSVVSQIFHLPVPVAASTLEKLTITQQMRSLKLDIQQKNLMTQLMEPIEFALGSPLEVSDVVFKNPTNLAPPSDAPR